MTWSPEDTEAQAVESPLTTVHLHALPAQLTDAVDLRTDTGTGSSDDCRSSEAAEANSWNKTWAIFREVPFSTSRSGRE